METSVKSQVEVKLFLGCILTSEIKMHLHQSQAFKEVKALEGRDGLLIEQRFQEKEYLGKFMSEPRITLPEVRQQEALFRSDLQKFCPELNVSTVKLYIFSQIFLH